VVETDVVTVKIRYNGDITGLGKLICCLREQGLDVAGGAAGAAIADKIRVAIRKYREMHPDGDGEIEAEDERGQPIGYL
jgi:hypothetical protein